MLSNRSHGLAIVKNAPTPLCFFQLDSLLRIFTTDVFDIRSRYSFGQLRLTRLNLWSKVFLGRFTFYKIHGQYGAYFARYYGPVLFIFGFFSVALSAMQVALAAQPAREVPARGR